MERQGKNIFVSFLFSVSLFIYYPLSIYYQNIGSVTFKFSDIFFILLFLTFLTSIVFFLLTYLITKRLKYFPILLTCVLIGLWFQGNIIKYDIGLLDGHQIDWKDQFSHIWFELLIWLILFLIFIYFRKSILIWNNSLLIFLLLLYAVPSVYFLLQNDNEGTEKYYLDTTNEFTFSNKNVILIVLDSFQSDAFTIILDEYPEYRQVFKDFIFFEDALGGYPTTAPSIPLILTGQFYLNQIPMPEFLNAIEETTVINRLKDKGYTVESYSPTPFFTSLYDNRTKKMPFQDRLSTVKTQLLVSGIRFSPLTLKPFFVFRYYHSFDYSHKDLVEFNSRIIETKVTEVKPVFKFIHLSGAHFPFQLNGSLEWRKSGYTEQAASSLVPMKNLLDALKNAGIYDDSLIIILGDHGQPIAETQKNIVPLLMNSARPLLLAKQPQQTFNEIKLSDSPVSLGDIAKTISDVTKLSIDFPGYSIFDPIPKDRIRHFYSYGWEHIYWQKDYLPVFFEYEIIGLGNHEDSWNFLGKDTGNK